MNKPRDSDVALVLLWVLLITVALGVGWTLSGR